MRDWAILIAGMMLGGAITYLLWVAIVITRNRK